MFEEMQIVYSIIIPHYNIPHLLVRCLKSIPVREDVQVIVVDDCSPDYATCKERLSELSRPNLELYQTMIGGSAGRARNIGLHHAKGKWLIFLDADDFLSDGVESILNESVDCNEDILFYNIKSVMSDDLSRSSDRNFYATFFMQNKKDNNEYLFRYHFHSLWGKIFRKDMIDKYNIRFSETKYSNDVFFSALTGYYAKTIKIDTRVLYVVTERQGSLASSQFKSQSPHLEECKIRLQEAVKVRNFLEDKGIKRFDAQYRQFMNELKSYYRKEYVKMMIKYTFTHPTYVLPLYKRDLLSLLLSK